MTSTNTKRGALLGGSVLLAALSSACCWLPLLAVALGFSTAGIGAMFEAYRWPLVALAAGFVVGGFVLQLRTRKACRADGCPPPRGSWTGPILGAVFVVGFAVFPEVLARSRDASPALRAPEEPSSDVREYRVGGMTCEGCTSLLASHLEDQPEIEQATVTYVDALVRVRFVQGTSDAEASNVIARVHRDWDGKYTFTLREHSGYREAGAGH